MSDLAVEESNCAKCGFKEKLCRSDKGKGPRFAPVPPFMRELVAAGGLLNYIAKRKKGA